MMTPPAGFVKDLRAYDERLRVRWGAASEKWVIEYHLRDQRHPQMHAERPPEHTGHPFLADAWDGWKEGYVVVGYVPPDRLHWNLIGPMIRQADLHASGGREEMIRAMDAEDEAYEASIQREFDTVAHAVVSETYDHMKWGGKERVTVPVELSSGE